MYAIQASLWPVQSDALEVDYLFVLQQRAGGQTKPRLTRIPIPSSVVALKPNKRGPIKPLMEVNIRTHVCCICNECTAAMVAGAGAEQSRAEATKMKIAL